MNIEQFHANNDKNKKIFIEYFQFIENCLKEYTKGLELVQYFHKQQIINELLKSKFSNQNQKIPLKSNSYKNYFQKRKYFCFQPDKRLRNVFRLEIIKDISSISNFQLFLKQLQFSSVFVEGMLKNMQTKENNRKLKLKLKELYELNDSNVQNAKKELLTISNLYQKYKNDITKIKNNKKIKKLIKMKQRNKYISSFFVFWKQALCRNKIQQLKQYFLKWKNYKNDSFRFKEFIKSFTMKYFSFKIQQLKQQLIPLQTKYTRLLKIKLLQHNNILAQKIELFQKANQKRNKYVGFKILKKNYSLNILNSHLKRRKFLKNLFQFGKEYNSLKNKIRISLDLEKEISHIHKMWTNNLEANNLKNRNDFSNIFNQLIIKDSYIQQLQSENHCLIEIIDQYKNDLKNVQRQLTHDQHLYQLIESSKNQNKELKENLFQKLCQIQAYNPFF